jgi:4-aminobutyrate--pyruvate transaminase
VRGKGLLAGVELVANKDTKKAFDPKYGVGKYCADKAEEHGLIIRAIGDTIAFCPPLIITESEIKLMISRFNVALDDTLMMVRKSGYIE